ncbi:MAG: hypothetical protein M3R38_10170 [Actinomycetota bacterium]|nr:hypothetical protein [Actinomycetota bacterium]
MGGEGDDALFGMGSNDAIFGQTGADDLDGNDFLFGAEDGEADTVVGGPGDDVCVVDEMDSVSECENVFTL